MHVHYTTATIVPQGYRVRRYKLDGMYVIDIRHKNGGQHMVMGIIHLTEAMLYKAYINGINAREIRQTRAA